MKKTVKVSLLVLLVLCIDQAVKIWVKTHFHYGEEMQLFGLDWALIHFVENPGMAFGIELGGAYGKLALSLFRILAVFFLIYYIRELIKAGVSFGLLASFALILAGAMGNIIDSAFYGMIFSESTYHSEPAALFPESGGYAGFLHGKVVDMLYFPIIDGYFPGWVPFWGGEYFMFFKPVFNIADMAITLGVINILLFQRSFFKTPADPEPEGTVPDPGSAAAVMTEQHDEESPAEGKPAPGEEAEREKGEDYSN